MTTRFWSTTPSAKRSRPRSTISSIPASSRSPRPADRARSMCAPAAARTRARSPSAMAAAARDFTLDRNGFRFVDHDTKVADFFDEAEIRATYYPEMEALVKAQSGASRVVVFDHTLRTADDAAREARKIREVVRRVHNDYTEWSGPQRCAISCRRRPRSCCSRRFAIVQVWRPIRYPVETHPLAICDALSLAPADLVVSERRYPGRIGQTYAITYNPAHRWYWFPRMRREEALVFKVYDSRPRTWPASPPTPPSTTRPRPPGARPRRRDRDPRLRVLLVPRRSSARRGALTIAAAERRSGAPQACHDRSRGRPSDRFPPRLCEDGVWRIVEPYAHRRIDSLATAGSSSSSASRAGPAGARLRPPPVRDRRVRIVLGRGLAAACLSAASPTAVSAAAVDTARALSPVIPRLGYSGAAEDHVAARRQARSGPQLRQGLHPRRDQCRQFSSAAQAFRGRALDLSTGGRDGVDFLRRQGREGYVHGLDFARELGVAYRRRLLRRGSSPIRSMSRPRGQDRRYRWLRPLAVLAEGRARQARARRTDVKITPVPFSAMQESLDAGKIDIGQFPQPFAALAEKPVKVRKVFDTGMDPFRGGADGSGRKGGLPQAMRLPPRDAAGPDRIDAALPRASTRSQQSF